MSDIAVVINVVDYLIILVVPGTRRGSTGWSYWIMWKLY